MNHSIENSEQITELWSKTYNTEGKPDRLHTLPYYREDVYFRESYRKYAGSIISER